jgi:hypothetical protein
MIVPNTRGANGFAWGPLSLLQRRGVHAFLIVLLGTGLDKTMLDLEHGMSVVNRVAPCAALFVLGCCQEDQEKTRHCNVLRHHRH